MELLKKENLIRNKRYQLLKILGIFLFLLGILYNIYNHYQKNKKDIIDNYRIEEFFEIKEDETQTEELSVETPIINEENDNYIGILEIPKINLKKGVVDKTSSSNNVNKNIYTLKETTLPDEQINSHIILASHSGNSYVSFFKDLSKLEMKDNIYFYYKGVKYIYEISNKYEVEKIGTISLKINNRSDITLITCISGTNKQVVYVGNLIDKENY